jgi:hypothetical protein
VCTSALFLEVCNHSNIFHLKLSFRLVVLMLAVEVYGGGVVPLYALAIVFMVFSIMIFIYRITRRCCISNAQS